MSTEIKNLLKDQLCLFYSSQVSRAPTSTVPLRIHYYQTLYDTHISSYCGTIDVATVPSLAVVCRYFVAVINSVEAQYIYNIMTLISFLFPKVRECSVTAPKAAQCTRTLLMNIHSSLRGGPVVISKPTNGRLRSSWFSLLFWMDGQQNCHEQARC